MQKLLIRIWNTDPLIFIGTILFIEAILLLSGFLSITPPAWLSSFFTAIWTDSPILRVLLTLLTVGLIMSLAYLQNSTYSLQSRAGMRNSNLYHLIAAVGASFTFFLSRQILVRNDITLTLLMPYIFATALGTVNGNKISIRIEKMLGIYIPTENLKGKQAQFLKLWPSVAVLMVFLVWQIIYLGIDGIQVTTSKGEVLLLGLDTLILLAILGIAGSFSFTLLRTARSSNSYWFSTASFLLNICVDFISLAILIKFDLTWQLFLPVTTGGVIGSLIGANLALSITEKIKAKFDIHVLKPKEILELEQSGKIEWPTTQIKWLSLVFVIQAVLILSGIGTLLTSVTLAILSAWQQMSFTLKSRAGQRNNSQYLSWSSIFSNGVWYVTLAPLVIGGITMDKAIPYIIGGAIGSLVGQLFGMMIERAIGALADSNSSPKQVLATK
jgi:hypothetical protein